MTQTGTGAAISGYPDTADVAEGIFALLQNRPFGLTPARRESYQEWFARHCPHSAGTAMEAERYLPGLRRDLTVGGSFPLVVARLEGAHLWDADGNRYVDLLQAGGATLLGGNPPAVQEGVLEALARCGTATGMLHRYEVNLARLIGDLRPAWNGSGCWAAPRRR